jgi:hypothetical protein
MQLERKNQEAQDTASLTLTLDTGADAIDFAEVAKKEHLDKITVQMRRTKETVKQLVVEADYQKQREDEARNSSELANSRVMWWSIAQVHDSAHLLTW